METLSVQYSWELILVSVAISMVAAYAAFSLADRMRSADTSEKRTGWLLGGAAAMGLGIWSMHYLGMLAVRLPIDVSYSVPTVLLSLMLAIGAAAVALVVVSADTMGFGRLLAGGALMGAGIGGMHYVGMSAMRMQAMHHYNPSVVALSIAVAVGFSTLALWMAYSLRDKKRFGGQTRVLGGAVMGLGIASMHYIAMAGVTYMPGFMPYGPEWTVHITALGQGAIAAVTVVVLAVALASAGYHRRNFAELQAMQRELLESQEKLTAANELLQELAVRDGLTGLHNRRHFDVMLDMEWRRASRKNEPLALLLIDIDHFKAMNDLDGHLAGDECLRRVAETIERHSRRPHDVLARYGGEEFAMLLPGASALDATRIAEEIRALVQAQGIEHRGSLTAGVITVSIGVCSRHVNRENSPERIVEAADNALYAAKGQGRNRVVTAGETPEERALRGAAELSKMIQEPKD